MRRLSLILFGGAVIGALIFFGWARIQTSVSDAPLAGQIGSQKWTFETGGLSLCVHKGELYHVELHGGIYRPCDCPCDADEDAWLLRRDMEGAPEACTDKPLTSLVDMWIPLKVDSYDLSEAGVEATVTFIVKDEIGNIRRTQVVTDGTLDVLVLSDTVLRATLDVRSGDSAVSGVVQVSVCEGRP